MEKDGFRIVSVRYLLTNTQDITALLNVVLDIIVSALVCELCQSNPEILKLIYELTFQMQTAHLDRIGLNSEVVILS